MIELLLFAAKSCVVVLGLIVALYMGGKCWTYGKLTAQAKFEKRWGKRN